MQLLAKALSSGLKVITKLGMLISHAQHLLQLIAERISRAPSRHAAHARQPALHRGCVTRRGVACRS